MKRRLALVAAISLAAAIAAFGSASAMSPIPAGHLVCDINGTVKVSPRLRSTEPARAKVQAVLANCTGSTNVPILSGELLAGSAGSPAPDGFVPIHSNCDPPGLKWLPSAAWKIVWKAGPGGTGHTQGITKLRGLSWNIQSDYDNNGNFTGSASLNFILRNDPGQTNDYDPFTSVNVTASGAFAGNVQTNPTNIDGSRIDANSHFHFIERRSWAASPRAFAVTVMARRASRGGGGGGASRGAGSS